MDLEGRAYDNQKKSAGKYTKASGLSSGMPYWMQSGGTNALWFTDGKWHIGYKSNLGTTTSGLYGTNSPSCPESVGSRWKYWDGGEWVHALGNAKMHAYDGKIYQGDKQFIYAK